ncbi:MTMR2, partial [Symbiodinium sp. KB8]
MGHVVPAAHDHVLNMKQDFRSIVVLLPTGKDLGEAEEAILALSQPGPAYTSALFAFQHAACLQTGRRDDGWSLFDPRIEFERMEVETSPSSASGCPWLLSSVNSAYKLCDTYPAFLALPRCIKEEELRNVASFRKRGRLPTMSWCGGRTRSFASLWRCSQPTEGLMGNNCQSDEKMLYAIRLGATAGRNRELLVLDLRPRKAAYANKVGGGGFESYSGCRLVFGGIDNVHVVRDAWKKMGQAVANLSNDEVGSWYRDVANSGWYDLIGAIFSCALMIVHEIESHHCNVVIHCSDGWDRTAQVSSVAMLCMDPYYRTVRGLLLLIQKEFCSFGHRFRTRLANGEKPTSEYSPVFLQWLEC